MALMTAVKPNKPYVRGVDTLNKKIFKATMMNDIMVMPNKELNFLTAWLSNIKVVVIGMIVATAAMIPNTMSDAMAVWLEMI